MNFDKKTLKSYRNTKSNKSQSSPLLNRGFTIVELLIVVVVIAILAVITIVAYNGVTRQAEDSAMQSSLRTAANKVAVWYATSDVYPSGDDAGIETGDLGGFTLTYKPNGNSYCMQAVSNSDTTKAFYISNETGSVQEGDCVPSYASIQSFTQAQCNALPTYTGSNEDAIRTVTDSRGGTTREYRIAKLADGNCWMLDDLKLGSTTGSITLTSSDSNVASDFTLPKLITSSSNSYDSPFAYGSVTDDSGSGSTNYGYLYNWPAATAGESRTSMPVGSGNAPHSICPSSWRLPRGAAVPETNEFAMLNAKMNNPNATTPSTSTGTGFYQNWQHTGPFKGVFAGYWFAGSNQQGLRSYLWSSSAHTSSTNNAYTATFTDSFVNPGGGPHYRGNGLGVRCLLD